MILKNPNTPNARKAMREQNKLLWKAEARVLVDGFLFNGSKKGWMDNALIHTRRVYGWEAMAEIKNYMTDYYKTLGKTIAKTD